MASSEVPPTTDVLIVGAGPTGLASALSLLHHGPPDRRITIIDALPSAQNASRALVIHSHTLELLERINAVSDLLNVGHPSQNNTIKSTRGPLLSVAFKSLEGRTKYPFVLLISQASTEAVLAKLLYERGGKILRSTKVVGMEELAAGREDGYRFNVNFEGGVSILTKYILGCDGGKSPIRHLSHIPFNEPKYSSNPIWQSLFPSRKGPGVIALADVKFDPLTVPQKGLPTDMNMTLFPNGPHGFLLFVPTTSTTGQSKHAKGDDEPKLSLYRIAFNIPEEQESLARSPDNIHFFQKVFDQGHTIHNPDNPDMHPKIKEIVWASTFHIRHALADTRHKVFPNGGVVLLAGDAAHIHSPAGGQGMNMGICDGLQAGKALDLFIRSDSSVGILERYSAHRTEVAMAVIKMTIQLEWIGTFSNPIATFVRDWGVWILGRFPSFQAGAALRLSGLTQAWADE